VEGAWSISGKTAGGSDPSAPEWHQNPQYEFILDQNSPVDIILWQNEPRLLGKRNSFAPIGFDVYEMGSTVGTGPSLQNSSDVAPLGVLTAQSTLVAARQVTLTDSTILEAGRYVIIPSMHTAATEAGFALDVHVGGEGASGSLGAAWQR